jgi:hypothetical protein
MVHTNVLVPMLKPVTAELGAVGAVTVPDPESSVHMPLPVAGAFPARIAVEPQMD